MGSPEPQKITAVTNTVAASSESPPVPPKITSAKAVEPSLESPPKLPEVSATYAVEPSSESSPEPLEITTTNAVELSLKSPAETPEITTNINAVAAFPESTPENHIFNFLSDLSPIEPVKAAPGAQDFHWLDSSPLEVTSPRLCFSQWTEYPQSSTGEESHDNDGKEIKDEDGPDEFEKSLFQYCRGLTSDDREEYDTFKGQEYEDSSAQASESQYGLPRHCVQFEEAPQNLISSDPTNAELDFLESSPADLTASTCSESEMIKFSQSRTNLFPSRYVWTPSFEVRKPSSGIGLHLNSLVDVPIARRAIANLDAEDDYKGVHGGIKPASVIRSLEPEITNSCPISPNVVEKVPIIAEDEEDKSKASVAASFASESHRTSQLSSIKKKKKTSSSEGKHCNCKKTGCLKLYCDCFAAGLYCAELCACHGCYNRSDYDGTVLETRQQIELRNPLAFTPKIVHANELNSGENGNCAIPTSGRHKRGCRCKMSMCTKKYCECYQANVGCSSGCLCDGCQNVYGRREECVPIEHGVNRGMVSDGAGKERFEGTVDEKFTPLTPSFQWSDHGRAKPTSQLASRNCLQSPESDGAIFSSDADSTKSSRTTNSGDMLLQTNEELMNLHSYNCQQIYNTSEMMDQFSPRFQLSPGFGNVLPSGSLYANSGPAKSSFPNWRQVSPPQSHLHELESRSSGDLRRGRKFILKGVPSFPPLTPCIDSRGSKDENDSKFDENNSSI